MISAGAQIAILSGLTAILLAVGVWIALRIHWTPERREKKRRLEVHHHGRLGDAMVTEATEETVYYSYSVRGVQYTASQDIATLRQMLPAELDRLIGVANLKYATNNPANSILICEEWSGLRAGEQPSVKSRLPG